MLPSYWASILCRHSLHFSSLYTGCGRASGRKLVGEDAASSLRPPTTCVNAYLVLCPPCGDLLAYDHTSIFQRNKNNNTKKKKKRLHWMENVWGVFAKFAVRSPGVASLFFLSFSLSSSFSSLDYYLFSNSIMLFHLTLPRRKGMLMLKGPIVFNCMHWRVAAQLKCFKCLCLGLKRRGSRSHRARPVQTSLHQVAPLTGRWTGCWSGEYQLRLMGWTWGQDQAHRQGQVSNKRATDMWDRRITAPELHNGHWTQMRIRRQGGAG